MALQLAALAVVSLMAYLEKHAVFYMIAAAMSLFTGFYWFDRFTDNLGLTFGICFMVYALVCFERAFKYMLVSEIYMKLKNRIRGND